MKTRWLILFTVLTLSCLPCSARPGDLPTFRSNVQTWSAQGQLASVVLAVRYDVPLANQAFNSWWSQGASQERARQLNVLARALLMEGHGEPTRRLRQAGLLWPSTRWEGTLFEDDEHLRSLASIPENLPANHHASPDNARAALLLSLRVGNGPAFADLSQRRRSQLDPLELEVLEVIAAESQGHWQEAVTRGEALLRQRLSPSARLLTELAVVAAARQAELPRVVDSHLRSARALPGSNQGPAGFILASVSYEREAQRNPHIGQAVMGERHRAAWRLLGQARAEGQAGPARWASQACAVWALQPDPSHDQEAFAQLGRQHLNLNLQPSQPAQFLQVWNPEFTLGALNLRLLTVERLRQSGRLRESTQRLDEMGPAVERTRTDMANASLGYQLAQQRVAGGTFEFSWAHGEMSRLRGLYYLEKYRHCLVSGAQPYDLDQYEQACQKAQQEYGGFLGLEDVAWDQVNRLFLTRPPGWQQNAHQLLEGLLGRSLHFAYRPGQIWAHIRLGELSAEQGNQTQAIASLRKAVHSIEEYLAETGGPFNEGRKPYQRAYQLLSRLERPN